MTPEVTTEVAPEVSVPPQLRQPWRREAGSGHLATTWDRAGARVFVQDAWRRADTLGQNHADHYRFAPHRIYRWEVRGWGEVKDIYDRGFTDDEASAKAAAERSMLDYHAGKPRPPSRRGRGPRAQTSVKHQS